MQGWKQGQEHSAAKYFLGSRMSFSRIFEDLADVV